jgi:CBS domain-containing protein
MQVKDVMTKNVISVPPDESVLAAARLMLQNHISGLPVIDKEGELMGIVTEGDFLRRSEIGTQRQRPKWLEFIVGPGRLAQEYVHASGRKVEEIMTSDPRFVGEDDSLEQALATLDREAPDSAGPDWAIRGAILAALGKQRWAPRVNVTVRNGVAELWGTITDEREREGLVVLVENVPGVKQVHDHLVWVELISAMAFPSPEDDAEERAATH